MKVPRDQLLHELQTVAIGLAAKETVEQSDCFVFQKGEVMTYNDEVACRTKTCLDITGAINAKKMMDMLSKSNDETIEFERGKGRLSFRGKRKKGYFKTEDKILLPITDVETPDKWHKLPENFVEAVNMVQECASKNSAVVRLNCVHFTPDWVEACDGVQAGRFSLPMPFKKSTLVRRDVVKQVVQLDMKSVGFTKNWVHFKDESGLMVSCHTYVEDYPSDRITAIFESSEGKTTMLPPELKGLTERVRVFLDDAAGTQWLQVGLTSTHIQVTGEGKYGKQTERQKIKYKGEPIEFSISPELLRILVEKHDRCRISKKVIKIEKDKFQYVTSLWIPDVKTEEKT